MKPTQIIILSVILGVLALGILLKSWARSLGDDDKWAKAYVTETYFFSPSGIDHILISRGAKSPPVELAKESGVWIVKSLWNAKADSVKIYDFLSKLLKGVKRQEFRGKGKNLFPDFGITDPEAFSIKLTERLNRPFDLLLGIKKAGEDYFIRSAGDDSVYVISEDMAGLLGIFTDLAEASPRSDFWADLGLFTLDPEKVTEIAIFRMAGNERKMAAGLRREADPKDPAKNIWKFMRQDMTSPVDSEKTLKFIATLMSIKAQKVADPGGKGYGLEPPAWQLAVSEGAKKTLLTVGVRDVKEDLYYAKTSAGPSIFCLSAGYFDDLNVDDSRFIKETPPAAGSSLKS